MCYGQLDTNNVPTWAAVFGWSNSEICKRNLESILLEHPVNNNILPLIEKEIKDGYTIKNWSEFDYVSVEAPRWAYVILIILIIITQGGFWYWAHINEFDKDGVNYGYKLNFGEYNKWNGFNIKNRW